MVNQLNYHLSPPKLLAAITIAITIMDRYKYNLKGEWASLIATLKSADVENKPQYFGNPFLNENE